MTSDAQNWLAERGWSKNPFTLDIYPSLFVGHSKQIKSLFSNIEESQKYILITGPTGVGKTTLLRYISSRYPSVYVAKPPTTKDDLVKTLESGFVRTSFLERFISNNGATIYNISERMNKKLGRRKAILLVDETHETNVEMLSWLRSIVEQVDGMTLIFAALPTIKENHLKELKTLSERITVDIELSALGRDEVVELIKKRISSVGGSNIEPFTIDSINEIYKATGGFPREVLKMCNSLVHAAIERNASIIDPSYISGEAKPEASVQENSISGGAISALTDKQLEIIKMIAEDKCVTPSQIANACSASYKSQSHALRAMNNILRRLERDGIILRERKGRTYRYFISPQYRSIFIKA